MELELDPNLVIKDTYRCSLISTLTPYLMKKLKAQQADSIASRLIDIMLVNELLKKAG